VIGVTAVLVDQLSARNPLPRLITNLATWATFPLVGGLLIDWAVSTFDIAETDFAFYVLIFGAFLIANLLNFLGIAGDYVFHHRGSLAHEFRTIFLPVLPTEMVSAVLCVLVAYVYVKNGFWALSLLAVVLITFQYLLRELLRSQTRAERLAGIQLGVLSAMIETLALRELALAMGLDRDEADLAHTAGLLHDVGKFSFPDAILLATPQLAEEHWNIVRQHPADGARIVRLLDGYGPVADIILSHHERWDGKGYPRGLAGEEIPLAARLISVADTYDVLTARDSYRQPVTSDAAIAELQRVAGTQLDAAVVDAFVELLAAKDISFRHADDAEFEAELEFERRVREYARPR
jgi:hypothetical protein